MSIIYSDDLPEDARPPTQGDWVAIAKPPHSNYLITVHWERGLPQPRGRELRPLVRETRAQVERLAHSDAPPRMPFYFHAGGFWVGIVDPHAADWSPAIAFNDIPA